MKLQSILLKQWYQNLSWLKLLLPFELIYLLMSKRYLSKRIAIPTDQKLQVWVVGNIVVGGTGKTPFVISLIKWLTSKKQLKCAVLLRGYKKNSNKTIYYVKNEDSSSLVGDEAILLKNSLDCPVIVTNSRNQAIENIKEKFDDLDLIICDDGLQHRNLFYHRAILMEQDTINRHAFPVGPYRTPFNRIKAQIDILVGYTRESVYDNFNNLPFFNLQKSIISFEDLSSSIHPTNYFSGMTVNAVAGIAQPQRFFNMLEEYNITVIRHPFPDHYSFRKQDIHFSNDFPIVVTAKDAVKLKNFGDINYYIAHYEIILPHDLKKHIEALLSF